MTSSLFERTVPNEDVIPPPPDERDAPPDTRARTNGRADRNLYSVDRDAEAALLAAFLLGADPDLVNDDAWTLPCARPIHNACAQLWTGDGRPPDLHLLAAAIGADLEHLTLDLYGPDPAHVQGAHVLTWLTAHAPSTYAARGLADVVIDHARRRRLRTVLADAEKALVDGDTERALRALREVEVQAAPAAADALPIEDIASIASRVDQLPAPSFIARPVWPDDAYGIVGAESKAGKTWAAFDLAVAVASGGSWLGQFPCERAGRVLLFLGEGGERKTIRRLRAICDHYRTRLEDLPLRICHRVPQLTIPQQISNIRQELTTRPASLVIVDPLYLAARGAKGSSLFEMATVLEPVQHACQEHRAALVVVHHWNQTGSGKGKERFSGAGSEEWGRVLVSVAVEHRSTDDETKETRVTLDWKFAGDEIPDTELRVIRSVRAVDPDDLSSPMEYSVTAVDREQRVTGEEWAGPTECKSAILALFDEETITELSKNKIRDELRDRGIKFQNRTIGQATEQLATENKLKVRLGPRNARIFAKHDGQTLEGVA